MSDGLRTALVTGGNRGIGFEACRQLARSGLRVVLTARGRDLGTAAAHQLAEEGLDVQFTYMDVGDEQSVAECASELGEARIQVNVLVNNAGTYPEDALLSLDTEKLVDVFRINFLGAFWTCRAFVPAMIDSGYGRVVNVSSGYGSFAEGLEGAPAYSLSKARPECAHIQAGERGSRPCQGERHVSWLGADPHGRARCSEIGRASRRHAGVAGDPSG